MRAHLRLAPGTGGHFQPGVGNLYAERLGDGGFEQMIEFGFAHETFLPEAPLIWCVWAKKRGRGAGGCEKPFRVAKT